MFKKKHTRKQHIAAVIPPADYELLKKVSEKMQMSMGEVIRQIIENNRIELEKTLLN